LTARVVLFATPRRRPAFGGLVEPLWKRPFVSRDTVTLRYFDGSWGEALDPRVPCPSNVPELRPIRRRGQAQEGRKRRLQTVHPLHPDSPRPCLAFDSHPLPPTCAGGAGPRRIRRSPSLPRQPLKQRPVGPQLPVSSLAVVHGIGHDGRKAALIELRGRVDQEGCGAHSGERTLKRRLSSEGQAGVGVATGTPWVELSEGSANETHAIKSHATITHPETRAAEPSEREGNRDARGVAWLGPWTQASTGGSRWYDDPPVALDECPDESTKGRGGGCDQHCGSVVSAGLKAVLALAQDGNAENPEPRTDQRPRSRVAPPANRYFETSDRAER